MRHDVCFPAVRGGRRDLQPRLSRVAGPLPARPGADYQDQRARGDQHAWARQALRRQDLQASTSEVYGDPAIHPQTEDYWGNVNPIGPRSCYDEGKRCAETLFFDYYRQHGLRIKVARIFNTYGPACIRNDGRVVSNFIVQALRGDDITIYGDGEQTRSFCYVDDLVEGFLRLMETEPEVTGPVNLGNPVEFTMMELAETVLKLTGLTLEAGSQAAARDDPKQRQPDISLAKGKGAAEGLGTGRCVRAAAESRG
jgi:UDP-glucuronate decarboxylase